MSPGLCRRLGGPGVVAELVDDIVDRHAANPLLAPRLRHMDLPRLKAIGHGFFNSIGAAEPAGSGNYLVAAGIPLGVPELAEVVKDVVSAMREKGIDAAAIDDVAELLSRPGESTGSGGSGPDIVQDLPATHRSTDKRDLVAVVDDALAALAACGSDTLTRDEVLAILWSMKGEAGRG